MRREQDMRRRNRNDEVNKLQRQRWQRQATTGTADIIDGHHPSTSGLDDDGEEGRQPDSLTCPTCREVIPLPPGGVTGFQRNFYLDGLRREDVSPRLVPCTLCDGDQPAQFLCGQCHNNFCSQCRRSHDILCQGSRVVALPPPSHSSNSAAQSSMVQGTAHRGVMSSAQASPRNLNDLYQKVEDLAGQVTTLQSANTQLTLHVNLLSSTHSKLFTDHNVVQREVTSVREKNDQLTSGQASLQREVRALRDKQAIAHQDLAVLTAEKDKACAGLAKLQADIISIQTDASLQQTDILRLKADHGQVAAKLSAIQTEIAANKTDIAANKTDITLTANKTDIAANKTDITANKSDITANKTDITVNKSDITANKTNITSNKTYIAANKTYIAANKLDITANKSDITANKTDITANKSDITANKTAVTAMQTAIKALEGGQASTKKDVDQLKTDCGQLTSDMAQVQGKLKSVDRLTSDMAQVQGKLKSVDRLTSDMAQVQGKLSNLESRFATANTQVGFSAWLTQTVTTSRQEQTLICDEVGMNEGGGYDGGTGVFTAPVTGTYLFLAYASPCDLDGEKAAELDIVLDGVVIEDLYSKGMSCSTGHSVVKMTSGQKMWLRTGGYEEYTFGWGWTQFSGMLLQAEV
ncbi:hypothetical protein ACOMHN_007314 [Nucella lapillus]